MTMTGPGWGREGDVPTVSDERGGHFPPTDPGQNDPWASGSAYGQSDAGANPGYSAPPPAYSSAESGYGSYGYTPPPAQPAQSTGWPTQPPAHTPYAAPAPRR